MKKTILIIVALLTIAQLNVFAYSDISDVQFLNKIETLSEYNIVSGYEDGTFRPDNNITRAEFCKLIMCATMNDYVDNYDKCFVDVSEDFWAEKYIYAAKSLGVVAGTTETAFEPDSNITNEQAVKMIVCALGYGEEAAELGGYPNGYIKVANKLGITSNMSIDYKKTSTRREVAELIYNILDVEYYFISLTDDGTVEKNKSESTLREFYDFLNDADDEVISDENTIG